MSAWLRIECVRDDLTLQAVDAIVNAANTTLRGGGGVDGAIHRAAGPELLAECVRRYPEGCATGEARLTGGHALPARWVIHTPGPVWHGGTQGEAERLAACHTNALALAAEHGVRTIAFAAISTGVYGYPGEQAAEVSLAAIAQGLERHATIELVRVVLHGEPLFSIFRDTLARAARK